MEQGRFGKTFTSTTASVNTFKKCSSVWASLLGLISLIYFLNVYFANAHISVNNFNKVESGVNLVSYQPIQVTRSVIECLQLCASRVHVCGTNVIRSNYTCVCLLEEDFLYARIEAVPSGAVYISNGCGHLLQTTATMLSVHSTVTETTADLQQITSSSETTMTQGPEILPMTSLTTSTDGPLARITTHTSPTEAYTSQTTTHTSPTETYTSQTTTHTSTTETYTSPTTTHTSPTETYTSQTETYTSQTTTHTSPTETYTSQTTTHTSPTETYTSQTEAYTPQTTTHTSPTEAYTSQTITHISTNTVTPPYCSADAFLCISGVIYMFSESDILTYTSVDDLVLQTTSRENMTSLFSSVSGTVVAAYSESTYINVITDRKVNVYQLSDSTPFPFIKEELWSVFFGNDVFQIIDDVMYTSSLETYVFVGDTLTVIDTKGKSTVTRLDNNGSKNLYKSGNHKDRPANITAACEFDSDTHLFVSNGDVYIFTLSDAVWTQKGQLVC